MKILKDKLIEPILFNVGSTLNITYTDKKGIQHLAEFKAESSGVFDRIIITEHEELHNMTGVISISIGKNS